MSILPIYAVSPRISSPDTSTINADFILNRLTTSFTDAFNNALLASDACGDYL